MIFENDIRSRAEQLVLAALLADNGCARHLNGLTPQHFSHDTHGQIFRAITRLIADGERATVQSVDLAMQRRRALRHVGLNAYLHALTKVPAWPANAGYYASRVRDAR